MNQDDHNTPKIGCVNHDCDKCKAQQPVAYVYEREVDGFGLRKDVKFLKPVEVGSDLYASPPASKPLPFNQEELYELDDSLRLAYKLGWRSAEAAHGIKEQQ